MKTFLEWVIAKKNSITNVLGFIFALVTVLQPLYTNGTAPDFKTIATAIFGFLIAWFTGKYPQNTITQ